MNPIFLTNKVFQQEFKVSKPFFMNYNLWGKNHGTKIEEKMVQQEGESGERIFST